MLKTIILENEAIVRRGIAELIDQVEDLTVAAELETSEQLMRHLRQEQVTLVVMEWRLPSLDGLETLARIVKVYPKLKVLVLSSHLSGPFPSHIWQMGVSGMVSRSDNFSELRKAIKQILKGERFISAEVSKNMVSSMFINKQESPFDNLTHREAQVLMMVIEGLRVQDISDRLCIGKKTVNTYRYRLFEKLGVKNEVDLTRLAMRYGVIEDVPLSQLMVTNCTAESQILLH